MTTATDLATITRCAHRIHLDATCDLDFEVPANAFLQLLWEGGRAHEEEVISGLRVERVSGALHPGERQSETRRLMKQGVPLIYHGYLEHGGLTGEPDLLERVEEPSALGSFSYIPVDIKSGAAFVGKGDTPKSQYLMQLCAYAELLEEHQGVRPGVGKIVDGNSKWLSSLSKISIAASRSLRAASLSPLAACSCPRALRHIASQCGMSALRVASRVVSRRCPASSSWLVAMRDWQIGAAGISFHRYCPVF